METRLNNNEVREVAEMQQKIDTYECFIRSICVMLKTHKSLTCLITTDVPIQSDMNFVWKFVSKYADKQDEYENNDE